MNRLAFVMFIKRQAKRGETAEVRSACHELLNDRDKMRAAFDDSYEKYNNVVGGPIQDFFDWLLDHADEILALIVKIVSLFGEK